MANEIPAGAKEVVKAFLTLTLDAPDEAKARGLLSKASAADPAQFHLPGVGAKGSYVVGEPIMEAGQVFVPVTLKDPSTGVEMIMPLAPVLEEGVWKLDMEKMMGKLMGGSVDQMVKQIGTAMGAAIEGIGQAMAGAMGAVLGQPPAPAALGNAESADLQRLAEKVAWINQELLGQHDLNVRLEVDPGTLLRGEDSAANAILATRLIDEVLRNFVYSVTEANREVPFVDRVKSIRLEGAREPRDRVVYAEGARIIYQLSLRDSKGFYDSQRLSRLFMGVAAGMQESAPTGEPADTPAYRTTRDAAKIVSEYREFVAPRLIARMAAMLTQKLELNIDWDQFAASPDNAAALWTWGMQRLCGAIGLLTLKEENRPALKQEIQTLRIAPVPQTGMRAVEVDQKELVLHFSPGDGEAGAFYEGEIAERISTKLKLRTRPMIAALKRSTKIWEKSLVKLFGVPIQYAFDWDGFTCSDDEKKNVFALTQLRESGIDWTYHALVGLAEKHPNFKQQVSARVRWISLEYASRAEKKEIRGEQTTLAVKLFLHDGYDGYFTIKDLEKAFPVLVAAMPDIIEGKPAAPAAQDSTTPRVKKKSPRKRIKHGEDPKERTVSKSLHAPKKKPPKRRK
jgi:hypothetical protein